MILIAMALICVLTVPLTGGRLTRLALLRLRGMWLAPGALAVQVVIVTIAPEGNKALHSLAHAGTYLLLVAFLLANLRVPGTRWISVGAGLNALVIFANGGVMPASVTAQRLAGIKLGAGFHNSAALAHPHLLWIGDLIPVPGPLPNVLSVGDLLIFAGMLVLLHTVCRRQTLSAGGIRLEPLPTAPAADRASGIWLEPVPAA
jgi:hypothetical protein